MPRLVTRTVRLHPVQRAFCRSGAPVRAFVGGRGSGKSWVACYDLIRRARRGRVYLVAAPTYPMLFDSEFRTFTKLARELGVLGETRASPPHVRLSTGAEVLFRSADDPEKLRGPNLSGAVLMEASLMPLGAYQIVLACLREDGERGWLSAALTPKGYTHWSHEVFATGRPDTELFRARTRQNPFLPAGFEDAIRRQYGATRFADQELGGEFVATTGAEFPPEWFDFPGFWFHKWPPDSELVVKVVYLDPSKGRDAKGDAGDYQAYTMAGLDRDANLWLDASINRESVPDMIARGIRICREWWPVHALGIEDNGTMGFLAPVVEQQTRAAGVLIPWRPVTNADPKVYRIRSLGYYLSQGKVRIRDTEGGRLLRAQLGDFPLGDFDDGPDSAAGAVRMIERLVNGG